MNKTGMLVAVEIDAVMGKYGSGKMIKKHGFDVYEYEIEGRWLYVIHSGAGELSAAAAVQVLISDFGVGTVVNFGVVGGLTSEMKQGETVIAEKVVHYDYDLSAVDGCPVGKYPQFDDIYIPLDRGVIDKALEVCPGIRLVACASGDKFVDGGEAKRDLSARFGADICEMELAAIALTCARCGVPCLSVKTVSDGVDGGAEEFRTGLKRTAEICLELTEKIMLSADM